MSAPKTAGEAAYLVFYGVALIRVQQRDGTWLDRTAAESWEGASEKTHAQWERIASAAIAFVNRPPAGPTGRELALLDAELEEDLA